MAHVDPAARPAPQPESLVARIRRRAGWYLRDRWPNRWVERDLDGVRMAMPWAHRLPDYMRLDPAYGMNLLDLAAGLSAGHEIAMVDVGANIGDSTLLLLDRVPGRVLAVEPDEVFLPFLRHNVEGNAAVVVEPSVLTVDDTQATFSTARIGGTATLQQSTDGASLPTISVGELRRRHPDFADVRLVKSDTDGYDVTLVPAIAAEWAESKPVLFFEYDHRASTAAGNDAMAVWDALEALGYSECAVWDNGGHPLFRATLAEARKRAEREQPSSPTTFWDVAAVHAEDAAAIAVIDRLVPAV
ncbi:FkbM family methyltransferase [Nocardioides ultimimeridianus]